MHTDSPARDAAREILDADALARTLARLAHELIERADDLSELALVGIHTRGVPLARRLCSLIAERSGVEPALGAVDISFHRDDVLFTGRTIRAAIDALLDFGRPDRVQLAVLVDRGHRELPIRPDYVGKNLPTALAERVRVELDEIDGQDRVVLEPADDGRSDA